MKEMKNESCPYCGKVGNFREMTFGELTGGLMSWGASLVKNPFKMFSDAGHIASEGNWKNFKCASCSGSVHQCGGCGSMEPYQDAGAVCRKCGYR